MTFDRTDHLPFPSCQVGPLATFLSGVDMVTSVMVVLLFGTWFNSIAPSVGMYRCLTVDCHFVLGSVGPGGAWSCAVFVQL